MEDTIDRQLKPSLGLSFGAEDCAEVPSRHPDRGIDRIRLGLFDLWSGTPTAVRFAANDLVFDPFSFVQALGTLLFL